MSKESKCALNVRGFPKELKWKCKEKAAAEKKTLGQFIEAELRKAIEKTSETPEGKARAKRKP